MLIYEKKVDGVRHLFGTTNDLPSESDIQLTYTDRETGEEISGIADFVFAYNDADNCISVGVSKRQLTDFANDKKINVWLGDLLIIGKISDSKVLSVDFNMAEAQYVVKLNDVSVDIPEDGHLRLDISVTDEISFSVVAKTELGTLIDVNSHYTTETQSDVLIDFTQMMGDEFIATLTIEEDSDYTVEVEPQYGDL